MKTNVQIVNYFGVFRNIGLISDCQLLIVVKLRCFPSKHGCFQALKVFFFVSLVTTQCCIDVVCLEPTAHDVMSGDLHQKYKKS